MRRTAILRSQRLALGEAKPGELSSFVPGGAAFERVLCSDTSMSSLPGIVMRRIPSSGHASELFEVRVGPDVLALKVPIAGSDSCGSMPGREWVFGRLAERMGLPVLPLSTIEVDPAALQREASARLDLRDRATFTATPLVELGAKVSWGELPPSERVHLFLWNCATSLGDGDRIRPEGPRDFYRCATGAQQHIMLDYEALPDVWDSVLVRAVALQDPQAAPDWIFGADSHQAGAVVDDALGCFDLDTWKYIVDGLDHFWPGSIDVLRDEMRRRVDVAAQLLR